MSFSKKVINAWIFYDLANSVFPLIITSAIFPNFYDYVTSHTNGTFTGDKVLFFGAEFVNTDLYTFLYALALSIVVIITPILSGIADYFENKILFLKLFCYLGSISCVCLYFFNAQHLELSFIPFITATIGFWGSLAFYNSYLPQLVPTYYQDKVSAKGFALGYIGSSILLIICLVGILFFKLNKQTGAGFFKIEYCFLMVGLWWIGFAQYTFKHLPKTLKQTSVLNKRQIITSGFNELKKVFFQIRIQKPIKQFLRAYFFFNMGLQTIMVVAVLFARKEIMWPSEQAKTNSLIISILLIQFVAVLGAYLFSFLAQKINNINMLIIAVICWVIMCFGTFKYVYYPSQFYIVAVIVGLLMGGTQALARSTYSKLLPNKLSQTTAYFSFYDVIEKIGMIIGTLSFGFISYTFGGMRNSILVMVVFFALGLILLIPLRKKYNQ